MAIGKANGNATQKLTRKMREDVTVASVGDLVGVHERIVQELVDLWPVCHLQAQICPYVRLLRRPLITYTHAHTKKR